MKCKLHDHPSESTLGHCFEIDTFTSQPGEGPWSGTTGESCISHQCCVTNYHRLRGLKPHIFCGLESRSSSGCFQGYDPSRSSDWGRFCFQTHWLLAESTLSPFNFQRTMVLPRTAAGFIKMGWYNHEGAVCVTSAILHSKGTSETLPTLKQRASPMV